jgi:CheY-like chemotaxis protein
MNRFKPGEKTRSDLELIYKTGERAAALTRQLLAFSRQQVLEPVVLDLNAVAADMDKMLRRLVREDIDIFTVFDPALKRVKADSGQIEQVIMNLVVNARDAMPYGGKLTIETANVELGDEYCRAHAEVNPGPYVMLAVSDTGRGIDAAVKDRIFEPFFTTKPLGKGTGLGLATVFGVVKQSDGHIEVYSEVGKGTTFKVYLPQTQEQPVLTVTDSPLPVPMGQEVILIVEDEEEVRELVRDLLEANGYTVLTAGNGKEALTVCGTHKGTISLVVTDVVMPEMGGPELAANLKAAYPTIKVLFTSGYTDHAIVRNGELEAGVAFIQKPFTLVNLARKVREVLDKK